MTPDQIRRALEAAERNDITFKHGAASLVRMMAAALDRSMIEAEARGFALDDLEITLQSFQAACNCQEVGE